LSHQQAEDHLTEAVLIICHHFEKLDAIDSSREEQTMAVNLNGFFVRGGFDDQLDKGLPEARLS
jgi:hypothetical protein